ncbi:hypothetical protein HK100_001921 [Physocladia obscura]|uniref:Uncharacterized protein n=1 Tax=Physocladia obscura TaxID=109957 RepID=A0AAD5XE71_9FUNG|nr:hypothetical protein HK100_001921 [Physocladia obscura]
MAILYSAMPTVLATSLRVAIAFGLALSPATPLSQDRFPFFNFRGILEVFLLSAFVLSLWESCESVVNSIYSLPLTELESASPFDQINAILPALKQEHKSHYETAFAFLHLARIARDKPSVREYIFNDDMHQSTNEVSPLWIAVASACIRRVESLRSACISAQQEFSAVSAGSVSKQSSANARSLRLLKSGKASSLLADSQLPSPSPIKRMKVLTGAVKPVIVGGPNGKRSFLDALREAEKEEEDTKTTSKSGMAGLYKNVKSDGLIKGNSGGTLVTEYFWIAVGFVSKSIEESGDGKRGNSTPARRGMKTMTRKVFADYEIFKLAVEAISKLLIAATSEDKYGTVHRDIPVVLECLINCLAAVEAHAVNPGAPEGQLQHGQIVLKEPLAAIHGEKE